MPHAVLAPPHVPRLAKRHRARKAALSATSVIPSCPPGTPQPRQKTGHAAVGPRGSASRAVEGTPRRGGSAVRERAQALPFVEMAELSGLTDRFIGGAGAEAVSAVLQVHVDRVDGDAQLGRYLGWGRALTKQA